MGAARVVPSIRDVSVKEKETKKDQLLRAGFEPATYGCPRQPLQSTALPTELSKGWGCFVRRAYLYPPLRPNTEGAGAPKRAIRKQREKVAKSALLLSRKSRVDEGETAKVMTTKCPPQDMKCVSLTALDVLFPITAQQFSCAVRKGGQVPAAVVTCACIPLATENHLYIFSGQYSCSYHSRIFS